MENSKATKIPSLIKDINVLMSQSIKQMFDETGLTTPQIMVMATISKHGSMKVSELSEKLKLSNSTVSGIVDRLEKQGYLERLRSEDDRRVVQVSLSQQAQRITHTAIHETLERNMSEKLKKAQPGEIEAIVKGLEILKSLLES